MEKLTDKIQDYIDGLLDGDELQAFEQKLREDEDFRNLVYLQREVNDIIHKRVNSGEQDLRISLRAAEQEIRSHDGATPLIKKIKPLIAVVSAACLFVVGYLFFTNSNSSLYELPAMQSEVVRGEEAVARYEEAVRLYNAKSYKESREMLNQLIQEEPEVVQYQYYAALTYVGEKKWKEALKALEPVAFGTSIFQEEATYYMAVCHHKEGNDAEVKRLLQTISSQGKIGEKAKKLLKKID